MNDQIKQTADQSSDLQGIINVYKPVGITSFFVVSKMRRLTGIKKIGHCGTLDPFAEGCLPICLGRATAAVRFMDAYDKSYRAEICLGLATDSEDCTGEVIAEKPVSEAVLQSWQANDYALIRSELASLEGEQEQVPPMHSAIKINGQPLYKLARQGVTVERKARRIRVDQARFVQLHWREGRPYLTVDFHVSKGTYVRTLGVQLAEKLGTVGHLSRLIRTSCGPFDIHSAVHLATISESRETLENRRGQERGSALATYFDRNPPRLITAQDYQSALLPTDEALLDLCRVDLSEEDGKFLLQGKTLTIGTASKIQIGPDVADGDLYRLYGKGRFIGIGVLQKKEGEMILKAERMFIHIDHY